MLLWKRFNATTLYDYQDIPSRPALAQHLGFYGMTVSLAVSLPYASSDSTKLGLERSTSKMTSGSVATRESARGQTPRGGSLSVGARIKGPKQFRYPKRSVSCIQPPTHLAVSSGDGGTEEGAQSATRKRNKLVLLRNPVSSKGMVEARPVHQQRAILCSILIPGRLFAKAKKARSPRLWL
jgi:hypothetical protein